MIRIEHLETDITQACQLSCVACNHHVPLYRQRGPKHADVDQIREDMTHFSKVAHADVWGALGGEPLMHPRLTHILNVVRESGAADRLQVWTNGLLLPRMRAEFWKSFDELVLSVYPGKHTKESLQWIADKCLTEGVVLRVMDEGKTPNFKTLLEPVSTDEATTRAKFAGCFFRQFSRVLNSGFFFTCCCAPHMPMLVQGEPFGTDGIPVRGLTEDALRSYLERVEPLGACYSCAGRDTAVDIVWREERDPELWLKASAGR